MDDRKKVMQPTFSERTFDRHATFSFAQRFRLNMRVRRRVTGNRWIWIGSDHAVGIRLTDAPQF